MEKDRVAWQANLMEKNASHQGTKVENSGNLGNLLLKLDDNSDSHSRPRCPQNDHIMLLFGTHNTSILTCYLYKSHHNSRMYLIVFPSLLRSVELK